MEAYEKQTPVTKLITLEKENLHEEVSHQAIKASKISGCLDDTVWSNKFLSIEPKVHIYKSAVKPILTYTAETRTDTAKTSKLLEVTEMNTLRIVNKTKMDQSTF